MADLDPLIRYRKHAIDEKRRALSELYRQAEELQARKREILEEIEREKKLAKEDNSPENAALLGRYLEGTRKKIRALDNSIRHIETKIKIAQEDMRSAFADLKKIEITDRNRKEREEADTRRKEELELDEIAIDQYRRRQEEEGE